MKKLLILTLSFFSFVAGAQDVGQSTGYVDRVMNVPVFMYAYPDAEFSEVRELSATWAWILDGPDYFTTVNERVREIVRKAKRKERKGKIEPFDALVIHPDDFTGVLIRFDENVNLKSRVLRVDGIPIFMYSQPGRNYEIVRRMTATWSAISTGVDCQDPAWVDDRVDEIVRRASRKRRRGKVDFDAIIIDPDSFTGTLIKYK